MKKNLSILTLIVLVIISCGPMKDNSLGEIPEYFIESRLSFFDPYEVTYAESKNQGFTYETWVRQPKNLRMLHETFKKIGYSKLISDYELTSNPCLLWSYVKRPLDHIIDSLLISYDDETIETKYYREFWQRRKNEQNDDVVYEILQELSEILLRKNAVEYNNNWVNDTLYNLVLMDRVEINPTAQKARKNFEYLKTIGMHGSAYNLLYENSGYQNIDWDRDELVKQLQTDNKKCCPKSWIMDNTK